MEIISLSVGLPREVIWHGRNVLTGIFKEPVAGRVALRKLNLDGDRQADLSVHGGADKAVYCYPLAHYDDWKLELPGRNLPMGSFGENFTIEGPASSTTGKGSARKAAAEKRNAKSMLEDFVHLGDSFSIGSAEVVVTQPRLPCYKLGVRFQSDDMVKRFMVSGRTGFYLRVTREGEVGAGDEFIEIARDANCVSVSEITRLYVAKRFGDAEVSAARRALCVAALPEGWKEYFRERLQHAAAQE